jgi:hypothetical protein
LEKVLAPFGVRLRRDILADRQRTISTSLYGEMLPVYVAKDRKEKSRGYLNKLGSGIGSVTNLFNSNQGGS